ncbi:MAG: diguanylate cyclase [Pseudomonadota bacterium]
MNSPLAARLLRIIFGCYFVVTLVVTCAQLAADYRNTEQRLTQELGAMQNTFGPGITDALWRFNGDVLSGILTGVQALPIIIGVKVEDEKGELLRAAGTVTDFKGQRMQAGAGGQLHPAGPRRMLFDHIFSRRFDAVHVDEAGERHLVGRWTVYSSQQVIVSQVEYSFLLILVNSVIKTLALWFIFLFVIRRALGQPLTQMSAFVDTLHIDNIGDREFVLHDSGRHELHLLTDKLNQMAGKIRKSVAENAALVVELTEMNRTLESQVAERTSELQRVASTDMLTGLHNRRKADEVLNDEIERVQRYGGALAIVLLDIDHFKQTNDSYGHPAGDRVLASVAAMLRTGARSIDSVGRWGGEEFMVICPQTDLRGAAELAEQLRLCIADATFPEIGSKTCSFGVAALASGEDGAALVARADAALYRAKQLGRNRVATEAAA